MTTHIRYGNNFSIDINQQMIEVTSSMPRPDPLWCYIDAQSHEHRWSTVHETFDWVVDEPDWMDDEGEEYPGDGHYACTRCGALVVPGLLGPSLTHEYMPGLMTVTVHFSDGVVADITPQQLEAVSDRLRSGKIGAAERVLRKLVDQR